MMFADRPRFNSTRRYSKRFHVDVSEALLRRLVLFLLAVFNTAFWDLIRWLCIGEISGSHWVIIVGGVGITSYCGLVIFTSPGSE